MRHVWACIKDLIFVLLICAFMVSYCSVPDSVDKGSGSEVKEEETVNGKS